MALVGAAQFSAPPPPTLTAVSPAGSGTTTNELLTVQVKATSGLGIANVEFFLNGLDYGSGIAGAANLWSLNFALLPGTNVIQSQATDVNGNPSLTNTLLVIYMNAQTNASLISVAEHWLRTRLFMGLSPAQQGVAQKSVRGDARDRREPSGSFAESAWY